MIKKITIITVFMFFLSCFFYASPIFAATTVTDKQKEVGQAIADFAVDVATNHEDDFGYSFYFGKDGKKMDLAIEHRRKANELGIKYCGYIYCATPAAAIANGGNVGYHENKFIVYCASFANLMVYQATGGYRATEKGSTDPNSLLPGDIVSIHQRTTTGMTYGHTFIYIDDAGDDDPYTMTVVQSPGGESTSTKKYPAVGVNKANFNTIITASNTESFSISSVERVSAEDAEKINLNKLKISNDLYDRLDNDPPTISEVSHNKKGEIKIQASDPKVYKYNQRDYNGVGVSGPVTEPGSSGIVGYQVTEDEQTPCSGWIKVAKTENFSITTTAVEKDGTYYVWVTDAGGNVASQIIEVTGLEIEENGGAGGSGGRSSSNGGTSGKSETGAIEDITEETSLQNTSADSNSPNSQSEEQTSSSSGGTRKNSLANDDGSVISEIASMRDTFEERGADRVTVIDSSDLVNGIAGVLTTVGVLVIFAGLLIIGIKYMVASPEEAAKLKTKLIGLVIAGVLIVGAYGIWNLAINFIWNLSA